MSLVFVMHEGKYHLVQTEIAVFLEEEGSIFLKSVILPFTSVLVA